MEKQVLERKPEWLRVEIPSGPRVQLINEVLRQLNLHTVCEEARCMNKAECWGNGTATFMVLGDVCTRNCRFCASKSAVKGVELDAEEPKKIADAVKKLGLKYVVLTSVDRDDLFDGGAGHFAECVKKIKQENKNVRVEVLIPDFLGSEKALRTVVKAQPDVIAHNIEVVERLQGIARDSKANYGQSLAVLKNVKKLNSGIFTKSSLMIGLGETFEEILKTMDDLLAAGCDFLTIGQYLQPTSKQLKVKEFIAPEKFKEFEKLAYSKGFKFVASAPLVRSSYKAGEFFEENSCSKL